MPDPHADSAPTKKELRQFALVFAGGLALFFGLLIPWIWDRPWPAWPWIAAAAFAGTGLLLTEALRPVYWVWMKLGHALGWFNTRLILGLVFFVLFAPVALLLRLLGKDPLQRRLEGDKTTYRVPSEKLPRERLEKPF
ncbi:MAG: SxtJ family membrane protein [Gammaproteobacteria bacterium]|jgi:hypothetical protein